MSKAIDIAQLVVSELDHFQGRFEISGGPGLIASQMALSLEPFVAAVSAANEEGKDETLLICRGGTPRDLTPKNVSVQYASYLSPFGRIVARTAGELHRFDVPLRSGEIVTHRYFLTWKAEFLPKRDGNQWDAVNSRMEWAGGGLAAASLRRFLSGDTGATAGREMQIRVALPGQAILDPAQDAVFREPFNSRILIYGSPGTGKTTVLLKRLSQKTKIEFLTESEKALFGKGEWKEQDWLLFTPNDLLKGYLREALAKEQLPAGDDHVKVYGTFRKEVLRELGVLKVGNQGVFRALPPQRQLLKRHTAAEYKLLTRTFTDYLGKVIQDRYVEAFQDFNNRTRTPLGIVNQAAQETVQKALAIFQGAVAGGVDLVEVKRKADAYTNASTVLTKIADIIRAVGAEQDQRETISFLRAYLRHVGINEAVDQLSELINAIPQQQEYQKAREAAIGLKDGAVSVADVLSLRRLIEMIPRCYADFRREPKITDRFFEPEAAPEIGGSPAISEPEQDVLLYSLLEVVRSLMSVLPHNRSGVPNSVRSVLDRFKTNICIDEVTDFSPLEIACMEMFASHRGGVTICGDLMQRVTTHGIKSWDDLEELSQPFQMCELTVSYRQTPRLFDIARDLYKHAMETDPPFKSAYEHRETDPPPLAYKPGKDEDVATWLSERVFEIFELCDNVLPSIAILVPTPADVNTLKEQLRPKLSGSGIEVDASEEGKSLGDGSRVRIFPVETIKGLEFEAVFYVGIDRMTEIHKHLIDKYFYVGLSRARSLLGVSYETRFPQRLDCIKDHFATQASFAIPSDHGE